MHYLRVFGGSIGGRRDYVSGQLNCIYWRPSWTPETQPNEAIKRCLVEFLEFNLPFGSRRRLLEFLVFNSIYWKKTWPLFWDLPLPHCITISVSWMHWQHLPVCTGCHCIQEDAANASRKHCWWCDRLHINHWHLPKADFNTRNSTKRRRTRFSASDGTLFV